MPKVTISVTTDPTDPQTMRAPSLTPLEVTVPVEDAQALWQFVSCLVTKSAVLIPAFMAIIDCAQGSAPPPRR